MSQCRNMLSMGSWESEAQHFQRQTGGWRVRGVQKLLPLVFFLINLKTFPLKTCTFVVFSCILCLLGWLLKWFGINLIQLPIHDRSVAMTVSVLFWWSKRLKTAFDLSRLAKGLRIVSWCLFFLSLSLGEVTWHDSLHQRHTAEHFRRFRPTPECV